MKTFPPIVLGILMCSSFGLKAQLIEDSQQRLKTAPVENRGFLFFRSKNKAKSKSKIPKGKSTSTPRSIGKSNTFKKSKKISPKYSIPPAPTKRYAIKPRFSMGSPFSNKEQQKSPRYSAGSPFSGKDYKTRPRYSQGSPFKGRDYKINPRYTQGSPFSNRDYKINPRYSQGSPFRGRDYKISPRYSQGSPFTGRDYKANPRYSQGSPFTGRDYKIKPRYSQGSPFTGKDYKVNPRYSQGSPFTGRDYRINPRYSNFKHRSFVDEGLKKYLRYYNITSNYQGNLKIKHKRIGNQHPSSNYHTAKKFQNEEVREFLRKWNIFWVRLNGNKVFAKGVKKKVKDPKYDRKERVLWND